MDAPQTTMILPPSRLALIPTPIREISLNGRCGYNLVNDRIYLDVEEIANNRNPGNVSGSLSLELWALPFPYIGGGFSGHLVASCQIGTLQGQHCIRAVHHSQQAQTPPEGQWYLSLMVREWDLTGYVTRDHMTFPQAIRADRVTAVNLAS